MDVTVEPKVRTLFTRYHIMSTERIKCVLMLHSPIFFALFDTHKFVVGSYRLRQRRGQIAGLHNFGRTCFLNTLLQALSACPQFIAWLQLHGASDKKSLIGSLLNTLEGSLNWDLIG